MKHTLSGIQHFIAQNALVLTLFVVSLHILLASWTVLNGDIVFNSDIARDFLLFEEISQKKLILIGPRASGLPGLFHGPLWLYFNYPAFLLGSGNPLFVGYFWVLLDIILVVSGYIVAKKLFNTTVASIYAILLSAAMIFFTNGLFNPFGAMLVMPLMLFTIVRYSQSLRIMYLMINFLLLGCMIQFQMAVGLPFLILTGLYVFYLIVKNKRYSHLLVFLLTLIPFSTFIVFDLRHEFQQTQAILQSFSSQSTIVQTPYPERINNRWDNMAHNLYLAYYGSYSSLLHGLTFVFLVIAFYNRVRSAAKKKVSENTRAFFLLSYFYFGYYFLTVFFNGILLYHYTFPLIPLIFLIFSSTILFENKKLFYGLFALILVHNLFFGIEFVQKAIKDKGVSPKSWQFQYSSAQAIFQTNDDEIGYFMYAPDFYGYAQKYAFSYARAQNPQKKVYLFEKKPITYVLIEPPPKDRPDLECVFWKKEKLKIKSAPVSTMGYTNGFKLDRYVLTESDVASSIDPQAVDWIHFR